MHLFGTPRKAFFENLHSREEFSSLTRKMSKLQRKQLKAPFRGVPVGPVGLANTRRQFLLMILARNNLRNMTSEKAKEPRETGSR